MPPKIVLGLIGTIGSGKDAVADYLVKKHGFKKIGMGDLVREATLEKGLKIGRGNEQKVSKELTDKNGMQYWAEKVSDKILKVGWEKAIINGMRRVQELGVYREKFGSRFTMILVDADSKIRFKRMNARGRPGDPATWEEFVRQEKGEIALYGTFEECIKLADHTIKNETTLDDLYSATDKLVKKLIPK